MPDTEIANADRVSAAFLCGTTKVLEFADGTVKLTFDPGWDGTDPASYIDGMVRSWRHAERTTVAGHPAMLSTSGPQDLRPGSVAYVLLDDVMVSAWADKALPTDTLIDMLGSVADNEA